MSGQPDENAQLLPRKLLTALAVPQRRQVPGRLAIRQHLFPGSLLLFSCVPRCHPSRYPPGLLLVHPEVGVMQVRQVDLQKQLALLFELHQLVGIKETMVRMLHRDFG